MAIARDVRLYQNIPRARPMPAYSSRTSYAGIPRSCRSPPCV